LSPIEKNSYPKKTAFDLPDFLKFAWLIRQDVRGTQEVNDIEAQKDFVLWWAIYGANEYPNTPALTDKLKHILFEPFNDYPQYKQFCIGRLLYSIYKNRKDLQDAFDIQTAKGVLELNQWFYIFGLKEHGLFHLVSSEIIIALNQPVNHFGENNEATDLPTLSPLIYFLWASREDIQDTFTINTYQGREKLLGWFFLQGVPELGLEPLINNDWLTWLNETVDLGNKRPIPRIGLLFWHFREDIQQAFDIEKPEGQQDLQIWTLNALESEPNCAWIKTLNQQNNNKIGVNLIGFAFGELGIGEDVRMAAMACEQTGIPYTVINISPVNVIRQNDKYLEHHITEHINQLKYQINIFCLTGFDTAYVYLVKGKQLFENRYNIGWWPWELPVWPEQWHSAFDLIDEIWTATTYTQKMYQQATDKPVKLMPLPVSVNRTIDISRDELGLPDDEFLFLYTFDFNSYLARKNPQAAVKAFIKAFPPSNTKVGLVLKTMNSDITNPKWIAFKRLCAKDKRITILEKTLDREKVLGLIKSCDAYLSLHRAEGFGRTLAEAMLFGKAVIATDFSGNTDFVKKQTGFPIKWRKKKVKVGEYPFITEKSHAYWAEPSIAHAAEQMKNVFDKAIENEQIRKFAEQQFSVQRIGGLIKAQLMKIQPMN